MFVRVGRGVGRGWLVGCIHVMLRARLSGSESILQALERHQRLVSKDRSQTSLWKNTSGG